MAKQLDPNKLTGEMVSDINKITSGAGCDLLVADNGDLKKLSETDLINDINTIYKNLKVTNQFDINNKLEPVTANAINNWYVNTLGIETGAIDPKSYIRKGGIFRKYGTDQVNLSLPGLVMEKDTILVSDLRKFHSNKEIITKISFYLKSIGGNPYLKIYLARYSGTELNDGGEFYEKINILFDIDTLKVGLNTIEIPAEMDSTINLSVFDYLIFHGDLDMEFGVHETPTNTHEYLLIGHSGEKRKGPDNTIASILIETTEKIISPDAIIGEVNFHSDLVDVMSRLSRNGFLVGKSYNVGDTLGTFVKKKIPHEYVLLRINPDVTKGVYISNARFKPAVDMQFKAFLISKNSITGTISTRSLPDILEGKTDITSQYTTNVGTTFDDFDEHYVGFLNPDQNNDLYINEDPSKKYYTYDSSTGELLQHVGSPSLAIYCAEYRGSDVITIDDFKRYENNANSVIQQMDSFEWKYDNANTRLQKLNKGTFDNIPDPVNGPEAIKTVTLVFNEDKTVSWKDGL